MSSSFAVYCAVAVAVAAAAEKPLLGAIYFGDWHVDPQMSALHGANWTEWEVPVSATPRFEGHDQPHLPLEDPKSGMGRGASENDPLVMAKKIDAAVESGIGMFLFDWYWYASPTMGHIPDLQGPGGGPFLDGALADGFMKAANREKMEFALMWANQDWVDIHPAKLGWHSTYRAKGPSAPTVGAGVWPGMLLMFDGYLAPDVYRNAFKHIAETYFTAPNYYKAPTRLANGTTAQCCFFSMYQPEVVAPGNETLAAELMNDFRAAAESVGQCLHLSHMSGPPSNDKLIATRRVDSVSAYGWMKLGESVEYTYPRTPYETVAAHAWAQITAEETKYAAAPYDVPYLPTLSVGWDSSPRTLKSDGWPTADTVKHVGYPWGLSWGSTVAQWREALITAKAKMATRCSGSAWCPPLLINAWNEWSEGAYLEPDVEMKTGKLDAIQEVFGPATPRRWARARGEADHSLATAADGAAEAVAKITVGAVRWDAWFNPPADRSGIVGQTVMSDLSPARYHYRLPFFAKEIPFDPRLNASVMIDGNSTAVMRQENACVAELSAPRARLPPSAD